MTLQAMPAFATDTYYDFSDEAQERFNQSSQLEKPTSQTTEIKTQEHKLQRTKKNNNSSTGNYNPQRIEIPNEITLKGSVITVPKDTSFVAILQSSVSSGSLAKNDTISATLYQDWVYNGKLIAPQGSILYGRATDVKRAGYVYSNGKLSMTFERILTPKGDMISLSSNQVYVSTEASKRSLKVVRNVAVGALSGLVTGVLYTLITGGDVARGLAIGSIVGAGGGLVTSAVSKGDEAEVPAGTIINVTLVKPMETVPYN